MSGFPPIFEPVLFAKKQLSLYRMDYPILHMVDA